MNDLIYDLILDKSIKRKVSILLEISQSPVPLTYNHLQQHCHISKVTLQHDLDYLIQELPNQLEIIEVDKKPAIKVVDGYSFLMPFIDKLIEDNPLFFIIESIFQGNQETIASLSERFFITETTLRKYLSVLQNALDDYNLQLIVNPLDILGEEINIRYFFFQYYKYSHKNASLIFHKDFDTMLYHTLKQINSLGPTLNIDYQRLKDWIFIAEQRISQKRLMHFDKDLFLKYSSNLEYVNLKIILDSITTKADFLMNITRDEILFFYLVTFDTVVYDNNSHYFTNDLAPNLKKFDTLTDCFFYESNLNVCLNMEFKTIIQAYLANLTLLTDISSLFQKTTTKLKKTVAETHPEILQLWHRLLAEHTQFNYPCDVAVSLTLLTIAKIKKHKRVLICLTGDPATAAYFKMKSLKAIPNEMEVIFLLNQELDDILLEKMTIDICIHNFQLSQPISQSKMIQLSDFPSEREWTELLISLHNM